ncbi:MAG TPA: hypothetical protein VFU49_02605 [Ktedonobacteraceae bacterium]|nr:hypothetical protein [Ktedonobacteraceae bacterium]
MHSVRLPRSLEGLDLAALNRRLQAGEIGLDWTGVDASSVRTAQLAALLAGLNLIEHIESIGADTIPESLQRQVLVALNTGAKQDSHENVTNAVDDGEMPALWQPEHDIPDKNATDRITLAMSDILDGALAVLGKVGLSDGGITGGDVTEPRRIELPDDDIVNDDITEPRRIASAQKELAPKLFLPLTPEQAVDQALDE